jgi:hypothetical protein
MSQKIYESYRWMEPFDLGVSQGKLVVIRGRALHATLSKNLRKYVREELTLSARSLARKYIDVNHEYSLWLSDKSRYESGESAIKPGLRPKLKGNVTDAEFEDGYVEYVGEVNHPVYYQKLVDRERMTEEAYVEKWGKRPIRYVSVDATYRFHREQDGGLEPHGIIFNGLSLVEDPESPGVQGTSVEVLAIRETERLESQFKILQNLLSEKNIVTEVVGDAGERTLRRVEEVRHVETDERKAIEKYNLTETEWEELTPEVRLSYLNRLHEQDEECPEGQHRNEEGECVPDEITEQEEEPCPEGQHRNDAGECVPNEVTEQDECPEGQHLEDGVCVPDEPITEQDECPEGEHLNEDGICVPDEAPLPASIEITKLPTLRTKELHLGEPFADYTSFEDCVAKNSEKEDPEAYCASIQQQTEGETLTAKLEETKRLHRQQTQGKSIAHLARRLEGFKNSVIETFEKVDDKITSVAEAHNRLIEVSPCSASVKRLYQRQRKHDTSIRAANASLHKLSTLSTSNQTQIKALSTQILEILNSIKEGISQQAKAEDITALSERLLKVEEDDGVAELKESFEALKKEYPTMTELKKAIKDNRDEQATKLTETDGNTNTLKEAFEELKIQVENNTDRLKNPDFKASPPPPDTSDDDIPPSTTRLNPAIG